MDEQRYQVTIIGTRKWLALLAELLDAGMIGRLRSSRHEPIAAAGRTVIKQLQNPKKCPPPSVKADTPVAPVELITLNEWRVRAVPSGGEAVDPRTVRRWASEGRLPLYIGPGGKKYVPRDLRLEDVRRKHG